MCKKHGAKVEYKRCSSEGCTKQAQRGGVCIKHGAKVEYKLCKNKGCTNRIVKGGVCIKHGAKVKRCSSDGCTNQVQKEGVCKQHGAKTKLCSIEGCTNHSKRRGVCWRHGANRRNPTDESTAFASCFGSEFEKTTATPNYKRDLATKTNSASQDSVPEEVVLCRVVTDNYEEV